MNPFDIKAALLAKHAQHVVLIHFPIALFVAGVAFDLGAQWKKNRLLAAAAYYNLCAAAVSSLPALVTGLLAWQWQLEGQRLKGVLLLHLVLGFVASVLMWVVWWVQFRSRGEKEQSPPAYRFTIEIVAVALVGLTGHLGGILSGVNIPS